MIKNLLSQPDIITWILAVSREQEVVVLVLHHVTTVITWTGSGLLAEVRLCIRTGHKPPNTEPLQSCNQKSRSTEFLMLSALSLCYKPDRLHSKCMFSTTASLRKAPLFVGRCPCSRLVFSKAAQPSWQFTLTLLCSSKLSPHRVWETKGTPRPPQDKACSCTNFKPGHLWHQARTLFLLTVVTKGSFCF